jgi:hypothetical protein
MAGPPTSPAPPGLGEHLRRIGAARDKAARAAAFDDLAREAERTGTAADLVRRLLHRDTNGQRLALEVAARLGPPLPAELISPLVALVERTRFPTRLRITVAGRLIRSVPADSGLAEHLIEVLQRRVSPPRAVNRLRRLAGLVPRLEPLDRALAELESAPGPSCPRCGTRLRPDELAKHLWERHRLLLESGRVREPWDVVGEWVADFARTNRAEYLDRASDLAQALDPAGGLTRVHRLLLAGGTNDEEAHALLRAEAEEKHASLCPHCYALVPQPLRAAPVPVLVGSGRVEGGGFRVELADAYLFTRLVISTPQALIFNGPEPGRAVTRRGAVVLFLLPLLAVACVCALLPPAFGIAPIVPVLAVLLAAVFAYVGVRIVWGETGNPTDRAVDHAWALLVPRLLQHEVRRPDAAFLAGLAQASRGRGDPEAREEQVRRAGDVLRTDRVGIPYLTPLSVLRTADAVAAGADDLPLIADEVGAVFDVALPLDHGERVVRELRGDPVDVTRRARLRVLVLARAFAAGLEPEDLRLIGRLSPTLGAAYASEDRAGLARLRLLWLYRPRRLWQRVGSATTVFDLARYPKLAENYLKQRPDLLLFQASGGSDEAAPILVCEEGVVYRDAVITDPDTPIRVRARTLVKGGGWELTIGERVYKFREDPTLLARRLKGWALFLFIEFLPRARMLIRRRSEHGDRLLSQRLSACPECGKTFLGLAGEIGLENVRVAAEAVE